MLKLEAEKTQGKIICLRDIDAIDSTRRNKGTILEYSKIRIIKYERWFLCGEVYFSESVVMDLDEYRNSQLEEIL
ncbi:MAG: hypothetical protein H0X63_00110 [Flavobacteriales bacterium]|nr:hypothetical protein [Flavobacteriales bacterium]